MKITTKIAGLLLLLICGLAHAEWVVYGETKDGTVFSYDPARVTPQSDGKVKVWYKETRSAQLKIAEIEKMARESDNNTAAGRETAMLFRGRIPSYKNYSHTLHRIIFDCRRQKQFGEEFIDYSTDGSVLDRLDTNSFIAELQAAGIMRVNPDTFGDVYPGTIIEPLMYIACKKR